MTTRPVLLGIFAHPDDESFGPGGTLARYAADGVDVHVIIATDGIAGSVEDPSHIQSHDTLAQVRSAELSNAAVALGIKTIWSLPYRDSGMRNTEGNRHADALVQQPIERVTNELFGYLCRLQPDVIITHDPFGGYGHPDHVCVYEATTAAFHLARLKAAEGAPSLGGWGGPEKLYYTAFDKRVLRLVVRIMPLLGHDPRAIGRNKDIDLVEIATWETPIHARVNVTAALPRKLAASRAHASQYSGGPGFYRFLPGPVRQRLLSTETFTLAYPTPTNGHVERDLFEGL